MTSKEWKFSSKGIPGSEREGVTLLLPIFEDDENATKLHIEKVVHHVFEDVSRGYAGKSTGGCRDRATILNAPMHQRRHTRENADLDADRESAIRHQPFSRVWSENNFTYFATIAKLFHCSRWQTLKLTVFRIHDILVWIRIWIWIRIRESMPLNNGSRFWFGSRCRSESCYFRHWPLRRQQKTKILKKSTRSHKTVRIKVFLLFLLDDRRIIQIQGCGSASVSGSGWICINLSCRIQIRNQIADPDTGGQKWPTKIEKSAGCSLLRAEGFFCSLGVLYGSPGISKLQFLIKKIKIKISSCNFFFNFKSSNPDPQLEKMLDPDLY